MFCIQCGKQLPDNAKFCLYCGSALPEMPANASMPKAPEADAVPAQKPEEIVPSVQPTEAPISEMPMPEAAPIEEAPAVDPPAPAVETAPVEEAPVAESPKMTFETPVQQTENRGFSLSDVPVYAVADDDFGATVSSASEEDEEPVTRKKPKKKNKKLIGALIAGVALVVVLAIVATSLLPKVLNQQNKYINEYGFLNAYRGNGALYLCYDNGKTLKINTEEGEAMMTPDREKILVWEESRMYWRTPDDSSKNMIFEFSDPDINCEPLASTNRYFFYSVSHNVDETVVLYRYDFKSKENVTLLNFDADDEIVDATTSNFEIAPIDFSIAYAVGGNVYVIPSGEDEAVRVGTYDESEDLNMVGVSPDGNIVAWKTATADGSYKVHAYYGGTTETVITGVDEDQLSYMPSYLQTDPRGKVAAITSGEFLAYSTGDGFETVKFSEDLQIYNGIYTTNGELLMLDENADDADGIYVEQREDFRNEYGSYGNLISVYCVNFKDGSKTKLVSGVQQLYMTGDTLIYKDQDAVLRMATINHKNVQLTNQHRIASNVYNTYIAYEGVDYVYYTKSETDEVNMYGAEMELFVYDVKKGTSQRIQSELSVNGITVSRDGKHVYFFIDPVQNDSYADLYTYSVEDGEVKQINVDVYRYSLTSGLLYEDIDPNAFWYEKKASIEDSTYSCDVCFFDGENSWIVVANVK